MVARSAIAFIVVALASIQPCVAADLIPVELRIVELHITDVEGGRKAVDLLGGFPTPQLSGEEAEAIIARVDKAVKPVRDYRMTVPVDADRGSKFHSGKGDEYAAGELSFKAFGKSSANVVMVIDMKSANERAMTTATVSDGTPGKTFLTQIGGLQTVLKLADGTSVQETKAFLVIGRVVPKRG
jgi:hypothetical protein